MKRLILIASGILCFALSLIATGVADPAHSWNEADLLQSCLRYERVLTTPANFPPSQRTLLALTLAAAEVQSTDPSVFLDVYRQAGILVSPLKLSDTSYTWNGSVWVYSYRTTYTYGAGSLLTGATVEQWSGTLWVKSTRQLYTYDGSGRVITSTSQAWQLTQWTNQSLETLSYDGSGNLIGIVLQAWQTSAWVNYLQLIYTYSGARLATALSQNWQTSAWVNSGLTTYSYDSGDHLTQLLRQYWLGGVWVNQTLTTSTYDGDGRKSTDLTQNWNGSTWVDGGKGDYTYDASGNEILNVQSSWTGGHWTAVDVDTSKYSGGYLAERIHYHIPSSTLQSVQYTHDGSGNIIADLHQTSPVGGSWTNVSRNVYVYDSFTDVADGEAPISRSFDLAQNYPNPFNPSTVISYSLGHDSRVKVIISNSLGQTVATVVDAAQSAGLHSVVWNGQDDRGVRVASGIYLYRVQSGEFMQVKKMVLLK